MNIKLNEMMGLDLCEGSVKCMMRVRWVDRRTWEGEIGGVEKEFLQKKKEKKKKRKRKKDLQKAWSIYCSCRWIFFFFFSLLHLHRSITSHNEDQIPS